MIRDWLRRVLGVEDLNEKIRGLQAELDSARTEIGIMKAKGDLVDSRLTSLEQEIHLSLVEDTLRLRTEVGLTQNVNEEEARLSRLTNQALREISIDAKTSLLGLREYKDRHR
jgi:hypothetical protein